jgi:hypothetical protein
LLRVCDSEDSGTFDVGSEADIGRLRSLEAAGLLVASRAPSSAWSLTEQGARWLADFALGAHRDARRLAAFLERYRETRLVAR